MSVSTELLCSFELLKPLDSNALKNHIKKGRNKRNQMLNSPVRRGNLYATFLQEFTNQFHSPPGCSLKASEPLAMLRDHAP